MWSFSWTPAQNSWLRVEGRTEAVRSLKPGFRIPTLFAEMHYLSQSKTQDESQNLGKRKQPIFVMGGVARSHCKRGVHAELG